MTPRGRGGGQTRREEEELRLSGWISFLNDSSADCYMFSLAFFVFRARMAAMHERRGASGPDKNRRDRDLLTGERETPGGHRGDTGGNRERGQKSVGRRLLIRREAQRVCGLPPPAGTGLLEIEN